MSETKLPIKVDKEEVIDSLHKVYDPELQLDIWTLGLIYDLQLDQGKVEIKMTFTTPFCPYGPMLLADVEEKVGSVEGVQAVNIEVVFEPPWQPSDEVRSMLGL